MMIDAAWLRTRLAEELDLAAEDVEAIAEDTDLISLGLDSLRVLAISDALARAGVRVHFSELVMDPTFGGWLAVIAAADTSSVTELNASMQGDNVEFPLATMQHAYWLGRRADQRLGGVAAHLYVEFDGTHDDPKAFRDALHKAVVDLMERHPMLRTAVLDTGFQQVLPSPVDYPLVVHDLTQSSPEDIERKLDQLRSQYSHQLLDLTVGEVWLPVLTLLPGGRHRLHLDVDMVAADAMSYRQLTEDLATLVQGALTGEEDLLPPLQVTYRDYLLRQKDSLESPGSPQSRRLEQDRQWWQSRLDAMPDPPRLPFVPEERRAEPHRSFRLASILSAAEYKALQDRAHRHGLTPAMVVATAFTQVLGRWSDTNQMLLNMPLFAREPVHPEIDLVVGDFTNSMMVSASVSHADFTCAVRDLAREVHSAAAHSSYTGLNVLRDLGRHRGHPVTANVVYTSGLDLGDLFSSRVREVFGTPIYIISQGPQVDLDAQVVEFDKGLLLNWDLRRDALPRGVADDMFAAFVKILRQLASSDEVWDRPCVIELPETQRRVREKANSTDLNLPMRTLHGAIVEQAQLTADAPAIRWRDEHGAAQELTYGQLLRKAGVVARFLRRRGVLPGDTVALQLARGPYQVLAILGVLLAGATYLPLGMNQPERRRNQALADGQAAILVTAQDMTAALDGALPTPEEVVEEAALVTPEAIAYVLFTSGSTGRPKGVEVSHAAAANTLDSLISRFGLADQSPVTLALSAYDFDLSVLDLFLPLATGGQVVLVDERHAMDAVIWAELISKFRVTVLGCAPGLVGMLHEAAHPDQLASLQLVLTGGDRIPPTLAHAFRDTVPGLVFVGLGGATEAAIHSTMCIVDDSLPEDATAVPYGVPLDNVNLRVVDENGIDAPDHVTGELWIGGRSLAEGYRGDPKRTQERFVFAEGKRWYRTGDLARYRSDGIVEILGRSDNQVKIRGFRVELGEVEAALESMAGVSAAIVVASQGVRLIAVIQPDVGLPEQPSPSLLRERLADLLPPHMLPTDFIAIETLPLTSNGKKDRKTAEQLVAQTQLKTSDSASDDEEPNGTVELALTYLLSQVFGLEISSATRDFFDLGGDSILATSYTARVREFLGVDTMKVADVLEYRSIRGLANRLRHIHPRVNELEASAGLLLELAAEDMT